MRSYSALFAAFLILLLAAPAAPLAAGTGTPAAPAGPPSTFNVTRLGVYDFPPTYDGQHVTANGDQAFLTNGTTVNLYDITNPYAPSFRDSIPGDTSYAVVDIDAEVGRLARLSTNSGIDIVLKVYDVSPGGTFTPRCSLHFDWSTWSFPQTVLIHDYGRYVYVGFSQGLAVVDVSNPVNGACKAVEANHDPKQVSDIVQVNDKLYLAAANGVLVFSVADPSDPNDPVSYPIAAEQTSRVAVSSNGAIFAATMNPWGLTVIYHDAYGTYPQTYRVSVVADGNLVYVGTDQDLQVIDALDLDQPLPIKLPLIGRYGDYYGRFYADLAVSWGLKVHSPVGIFQYRPDLWLEAQGAGTTVNGTAVPSSASVKINAGDRIGLQAPDGAATLEARCSTDRHAKVVRMRKAWKYVIDESTPTFVGVINSVSVMEEYMKLQCEKPLPDAFPAADPPALPLNLESGGLELDVLTALGTIQVDTTNARSQG